MLDIILIKLLCLLACELFVFNCSRNQLKTGVVARLFNFIFALLSAFAFNFISYAFAQGAFKLPESGPRISPLE